MSYPIARPEAGHAEQDPEDWWRAVRAVLRQLGDAVDLRSVVAIGVCSQVNTHVFIDDEGRPLAPAIVWQDQRCADTAEHLDASLSEEERLVLWGAPFRIDSSFLLARAEWMRVERPELWQRTRWVVSPKDYVNLRLTGAVATDVISPIGLVGPDHRYIPGVLALVPEAAQRMPPLRPFTAALGSVVAAATGLPPDAIAVVATMDAWGNVYGSGVVDAGQAIEVAGTSEIIGVLSDHSTPEAGVISFLPVDGLVLHAGPTQAGGDALRWLANALQLSIPQTVAAAATVPPGALGLVFLPYLLGERAPLWDARARGVFFGLSSDHGAPHLARGVLEGVACSARHLLEATETAAGRPVERIRASGGASRSDLWCQIKADVLGRPLERVAVPHSAVLGAALLAGVGAGRLESVAAAARRMVHVERAFHPDPRARDVYDELYALYRALYPSVQPLYRQLARLREVASESLRRIPRCTCDDGVEPGTDDASDSSG